VSLPAAAEVLAGLKESIGHASYSEYGDLREPIIGISRDGTMAWSVVQVRVQGDRSLADGSSRKIDFVCAWLTVYEKTSAGWKVKAEVSTFK